MKRLLFLWLMSVMCLSACSNSKPDSPQESETVPTQAAEPVFNEPDELTAMALLTRNQYSSYQCVTVEGKLLITEIVNNRAVSHEVTNTITYQADESRTYSIIQWQDTTEAGTVYKSELVYIDSTLGRCFVNKNYKGWKMGKRQFTYGYWNDNIVNPIVDTFETKGENYVVTGLVTSLSGSSLDHYINYILSTYKINNTKYAFTAKYNVITNDVSMITATVDVDADGEYDGNKIIVEQFDVTVMPVDKNDIYSVEVPEYIIKGAKKAKKDKIKLWKPSIPIAPENELNESIESETQEQLPIGEPIPAETETESESEEQESEPPKSNAPI